MRECILHSVGNKKPWLTFFGVRTEAPAFCLTDTRRTEHDLHQEKSWKTWPQAAEISAGHRRTRAHMAIVWVAWLASWKYSCVGASTVWFTYRVQHRLSFSGAYDVLCETGVAPAFYLLT